MSTVTVVPVGAHVSLLGFTVAFTSETVVGSASTNAKTGTVDHQLGTKGEGRGRTKDTEIDTLRMRGGLDELNQELGVVRELEGQSARGDVGVSTRRNLGTEVLRVDLAKEEGLVRRVREDADKVDRRGERIREVERRHRDPSLRNVERERESCRAVSTGSERKDETYRPG